MYERIKTSKTFPDNLINALGITYITPALKDNIIKLLSTVKYRQADSELLLRMYYEDNLTMTEIGNKFNLSKERIRQKLNLALSDIRRNL